MTPEQMERARVDAERVAKVRAALGNVAADTLPRDSAQNVDWHRAADAARAAAGLAARVRPTVTEDRRSFNEHTPRLGPIQKRQRRIKRALEVLGERDCMPLYEIFLDPVARSEIRAELAAGKWAGFTLEGRGVRGDPLVLRRVASSPQGARGPTPSRSEPAYPPADKPPAEKPAKQKVEAPAWAPHEERIAALQRALEILEAAVESARQALREARRLFKERAA